MLVHVLGLGSVGTVIAHVLNKAAVQVNYLSPRPLTPIIHDLSGVVIQLHLWNDTLCSDPLEVLFITTKAHQTSSAIKPHLSRINPFTLLIFLQNGLGVTDSLSLPTMRIVDGTSSMGAYRDEKGHVRWVSRGQWSFAPRPNTQLSSEETRIISSLGEIVPYVELLDRRYLKLALNACINPVTAVYGLPNACIAELASPANELARKLAREVQLVYEKVRPETDVARLMDRVEQLARDTAGNTSSMLADVKAGKGTEIEFINGYIVQLARSTGIRVPENEDIIRRVKTLKR
jgi:2-dehydropantoate 2-reductase